MESKRWWLTLFAIVVLGAGLRSYGLTDHWGKKDHYNWGGPFHSIYTFCLRESSWAESRGRLMVGCPEEAETWRSPLLSELSTDDQAAALAIGVNPDIHPVPEYYLNHSPFYGWMLAGATSAFGESEWVFRSTTLFFSLLNIILVALIARKAFAGSVRADQASLWAAFFQAGILGGLYFGTHVDYMNEFAASFVLAAVWAAISNRWLLAGAIGLIAGLFDWPGFFLIPAVFLLALIVRRGRAKMTAFLILMPFAIAGIATYLVGSREIVALFENRLLHSGHVAEPKSLVEWLLFPLQFLLTMWTTHTRLLSPVFFALALSSLIFGLGLIRGQSVARLRELVSENRFVQAMLVFALTMGALIALGVPYVMQHPFFFMPTIGFWTIGLAHATLDREPIFLRTKSMRRWTAALLFFACALYPFGIYKFDARFDLLASALIAGASLWAIARVLKGRTPLTIGLVSLVILGNLAETINYRTEDPVDHDICLHQLKTYLETGEKADVPPEANRSRLYYCRGIPRK